MKKSKLNDAERYRLLSSHAFYAALALVMLSQLLMILSDMLGLAVLLIVSGSLLVVTSWLSLLSVFWRRAHEDRYTAGLQEAERSPVLDSGMAPICPRCGEVGVRVIASWMSCLLCGYRGDWVKMAKTRPDEGPGGEL